MKTIDIRKDIHLLIDSIESENLLKNFYEVLKQSILKKQDNMWDKLSSKEQEELLLSFEESFIESNLLSNEEVKNKYAKWL